MLYVFKKTIAYTSMPYIFCRRVQLLELAHEKNRDHRTPNFTEDIDKLLKPDEYRTLQL